MNQPQVYVSNEYAEGKIDRKHRMLESIARMLSKNYGVNIVFSPTGECSTNKERMILPYEKNVDEALILGLCGHETGHLRETDFKVKGKIAEYPGVYNHPLLFAITNALEDVRVERIMEEAYMGFVDLFERMVPYIRETKEPMLQREELKAHLQLTDKSPLEIADRLQEFEDEYVEAITEACKKAGLSKKFIDQEVDRFIARVEQPIPIISKILDVLYLNLRNYEHNWYPPEVVDFVTEDLVPIGKEVYNCNNVYDVVDVAVKIYRIIEQAARKGLNNKKGKNLKSNKSKKSGSSAASKKGKTKAGKVDISTSKTQRMLQVGTKVRHLAHPKRIGVIKAIDPDSKEITVEWGT